MLSTAFSLRVAAQPSSVPAGEEDQHGPGPALALDVLQQRDDGLDGDLRAVEAADL
jgi:hypothetical protein